MKNKTFKLFQCCIPVKGIKNGVIIDFQRKALHKVPNQIIDLIEEYSKKDIYSLFYDFNKSKKTLKNYIRYFIENELLIVSNQTENYPRLNNTFYKPAFVDNIKIEIDDFSSILEKFFENEINDLGTNSVKLILKNNEVENLIKLNTLLEESKIKVVVLYLEYSEVKFSQLKSIIVSNPRISMVIFYNFDSEIPPNIDRSMFYFEKPSLEEIFENKIIESASDFALDIEIYLEALHHNLMFNKTVFIDSFGNIKRHLEDPKTYGNINKNKVIETINNNEFNTFWNINKDQIEVCKDCEFRYICPDGRIPHKTQSENVNYTFNTNCNYDPYQGVWKQ